MLQDITTTNEGIVTNSDILMGSFSSSSRQSSESLASLLLISMNFDISLTPERKFEHKYTELWGFHCIKIKYTIMTSTL